MLDQGKIEDRDDVGKHGISGDGGPDVLEDRDEKRFGRDGQHRYRDNRISHTAKSLQRLYTAMLVFQGSNSAHIGVTGFPISIRSSLCGKSSSIMSSISNISMSSAPLISEPESRDSALISADRPVGVGARENDS